jgi:nicotinamidase-related amidase
MPLNLPALIKPADTVVLTVEMQRGVIGDQVTGPNGEALRDAAEASGVIPATTKLVRAARSAGVRVVHATITLRADRAGLSVNNRMMKIIVRNPDQMLEGTPAVELIPELELDKEKDLVMNRVHGLTPFGSTELDPVLRNLGIRTIIPVGVSLNVAILGTCLAASDLGYQIVLPRDAIIAIPESYADPVFDNTLSHLATVSTVDDVVAAWG